MDFKTKEEKLWEVFKRRLRDGASNNANTPSNKRLIYTLSCYVWGWRQEYKTECSSYQIGRKTYNGLLQTVKELEDQIQSGAYEAEARKAVQDAYSWLESLLANRIRLTKAEKPRVF